MNRIASYIVLATWLFSAFSFTLNDSIYTKDQKVALAGIYAAWFCMAAFWAIGNRY